MESSRRSPIKGKHIRFRSNSPPSPSPSTSSTINQSSWKRQSTISESITFIQSPNKAFRHSHTSSSNSTYRHQHNKRRRRNSFRQWVFSPRACSHLKDEIVVVSYNILGVKNAENHPHLYDQVAPHYLDWESRKMRICRELSSYKASILCLQEVDRFSDLADILKEDGFDGIYKARTGEACDGCAIFWREDLFTLVHQESIEFQEFNLRDNVAQFCILKMKLNHSRKNAKDEISQTQTLLIGNTHTLFNPNRGDIKLGQIRLLLKKAHTLSEEWGNIPIVIAGDLNSTPQSAIYKFLASSELDLLQHNRSQLSGMIERPLRWRSFKVHTEVANSWSKEELQLAAGSEGVTRLQHYLQLQSAYSGVPGGSSTRDGLGEPLATSYHSRFLGTVDYIWHSKNLVPTGVVETLPVDTLKRMRGLPSEDCGSDHLALVCKLAFVDDRNRSV